MRHAVRLAGADGSRNSVWPHWRVGVRGMSLLEILVALTILGFSLAALYRAGAQGVAGMGYLEQRAYALSHAESLLAMHQGIPPSGVSASGSLDDTFSWRLISAPHPPEFVVHGFEVEQDVWPFHSLTAQISWSSRGQEHSVSLTTLLPERSEEVR